MHLRKIQGRSWLRAAQALRKAEASTELPCWVWSRSRTPPAYGHAGAESPTGTACVAATTAAAVVGYSRTLVSESILSKGFSHRISRILIFPFGNLLFAVRADCCAACCCCWAPKPAGIPRIFWSTIRAGRRISDHCRE